jgi:hypothetical protein
MGLLLALAACGDEAPTAVRLDPPDITGSWRFSWTVHERYTGVYVTPVECSAAVEFTISGDSSGLHATQEGTAQLACDDGLVLDLDDGALKLDFLSPESLRIDASWSFTQPTFSATAALTDGSQSAMAGVGQCRYSDDNDFIVQLIGVFTAEMLP